MIIIIFFYSIYNKIIFFLIDLFSIYGNEPADKLDKTGSDLEQTISINTSALKFEMK